MSTKTRAELSREIARLKAAAEAQLAKVRGAAQVAERAKVAYYGQSVADFEGGKRRAESAAQVAEKAAESWLLDARQAMKAINDQLSGPSGWGLSPEEWRAVGNLGRVATSVMVDGSLSSALAELRSAIRAGDRARAAAFSQAAETRLRSQQQTRPAGEGRISSVRAQDEQELRSLISQARALCRDSSLDDVREQFRGATAAVGMVGSELIRAQAARKPFETFDGRPKVHWPVKDGDGRLVHPETGEPWQAWSDRTEREKQEQLRAQRGQDHAVAVPVAVQADGSLVPVAPPKAS